MITEKTNECVGGPKLIFSCSGAADVGELSDLAARKLMKNGAGKMFCLVGIGDRVEGIMQKTRDASRILAIDGCGLDCAKKCLKLAGFDNFEHVRVTDLGFEKGNATINDQSIDIVVQTGTGLLG
jgi:uncharacterized metal-binding protein